MPPGDGPACAGPRNNGATASGTAASKGSCAPASASLSFCARGRARMPAVPWPAKRALPMASPDLTGRRAQYPGYRGSGAS